MNKTSPSDQKRNYTRSEAVETTATTEGRGKPYPSPITLSPSPRTHLSFWLGRSLALHSVILISSQRQRYNGCDAKKSTLIFVKFLYYILPGALFFYNNPDRLQAEGQTLFPFFWPQKFAKRTLFLNTRLAPWSEAENNLRNK